jgi:hypothetical protein
MHDSRFLSGNTVKGDQSNCGQAGGLTKPRIRKVAPFRVGIDRVTSTRVDDRTETSWKMFSFIELPLYRSCQYYPFGCKRHRNYVILIFHPSEPVFSTNGLCGFIGVRLEPLPRRLTSVRNHKPPQRKNKRHSAEPRWRFHFQLGHGSYF